MERGVLPRQEIIKFIEQGIIKLKNFNEKLLQPGSIDLPIGNKAYHVSSSFLPKPDEPVEKYIEQFWRGEVDLTDSKGILKKNNIYVIPINTELNLPSNYWAQFNPKSTTGRSGLSSKVVSDGHTAFDETKGASGKIYVIAQPKAFDTKIKEGLAIGQMKLWKHQIIPLGKEVLQMYNQINPLIHDEYDEPIPLLNDLFKNSAIKLTVDLESDVVAYRSKANSNLVYDLSGSRGSMNEQQEKFWEKITAPEKGQLLLEPGYFYIMGTRERVRFPRNISGTLEYIDKNAFEGYVHEAGFMDIGFGFGENGELPATHITLEMRVFEPFTITHGQYIGKMNYEPVLNIPTDKEGKLAVYGAGIYKLSNYQAQPRGPTLGKQFLEPKK
ncbi:2'-deoxycytidine 5'-triphosphate deaminase [Candidatus Woesearchaeota archaeon]|nr:2'-deoxycytidine 5'-triphosphate deaminase [Candidatus Woesearchaeota archaeon]